MPVWQKSFHDRIVRNNHELERIQKYIRNNPLKWAEDRDNPSGPRYGPAAKSIDDYWNEIFDTFASRTAAAVPDIVYMPFST